MKKIFITILCIAIFIFTGLICGASKAPESPVSNKTLGSAPGSYKLISKKDAMIIPFEFYGMNLLIHGEMNGKKIKMLIDNGLLWDDIWFYNGEVDSLNLFYKNNNEYQVTGAGEDGGSTIKEGGEVDVSFGNLEFLDQPTLISVPEAGYDKLFPGINGQVCSLLFKNFIVKFDFDQNIIILEKPEDFSYEEKGHYIPMMGKGNGPYNLFVRLNDSDKELAVDIDLGGIFPLHLFENKESQIFIPENAVKTLIGYGASGAMYGYNSNIKSLRIGNYTLKNVSSIISENEANIGAEKTKAGTIGLPVFKRFNITFDYFNNRIYLEPNKHFNEPFEKFK